MQKDKFTKDTFKCNCGAEATGILAGNPICFNCISAILDGTYKKKSVFNPWLFVAMAVCFAFFYFIYWILT